VIGEGNVTILRSFAQLYVDRLTVAVDVPDLEMNSFPYAQPTGIDRAQTNPVSLVAYTAQNPLHFRHTEHHG
jgi:hypothetical protein